MIDQLGNDDALLFNSRFRGKYPNDDAGRSSLRLALVKIRQQLQDLRAIEDFKDSDVTVEQGAGKKAIVVSDTITVVNTMSQLYMTTVVK